jgi:two-component system chemotaxis response regulator CheB
MIRVAIADDSPFTCKLLASYLEENGDCQVVGFAHDAPSTLDMVRASTPDVLTLDLQMPGGDGLDLLRQVGSMVSVPIVVISGISRRAAATTLRALELGAVDFVLKYTHGAPVSAASLKREIVTKVKAAAGAQVARARPVAVPPAETSGPRPVRPVTPVAAKPSTAPNGTGVIVIGASTGGPRAVGELLSQLPADFGTCCVIVQHLPALFTAPFAEQLSRHTSLRVRETAAGDRLEPGHVFVTPGAFHVLVRPDGRLELQAPTDRDRYHPSIDLAMTTAAESFGAAAIGVVLTGMGQDGAEGLKRIREVGGKAYVQEPASSVMASMPKRAARAASAGNARDVVSCHVTGRLYAFDSADVRFIVRSDQVFPAAEDDGRIGELRTPEVIPVYSVAALLHPSAASDDGEHVIVTQSAGTWVGWQVDRVLRGGRGSAADLLPLPDLTGPIARRWFKALLNGQDEPGLVCSPVGMDPRAAECLAQVGPRPGPVPAGAGVSGVVAVFSSPALPRCSAERYALSARCVLSVAQSLSPRRVPGTPSYVVGLAAWRGFAVPLLDLSGRSGSVVSRQHGRYLLAQYRAGSDAALVAIAIDRDVVLHHATSADKPLAAAGAELPAGVTLFDVNGERVGLLDLDALIAACTGRSEPADREPAMTTRALHG